MSINRCDLCYELQVSACESSYTFPIGLSHNQTYTMVLEDLHGNIFEQDGSPTQGSGGLWTITVSDFPEGMFNAYSGTYEITFEHDGVLVPIVLDTTEYQCIVMKFKDVTVV